MRNVSKDRYSLYKVLKIIFMRNVSKDLALFSSNEVKDKCKCKPLCVSAWIGRALPPRTEEGVFRPPVQKFF